MPDRPQCGIFLLAGLSLPTNQLAAAALQWKEHALIQSFNLGFMPLVMLGVCMLVGPTGLFERSLLDGLLVMSALPTTVNMCVALTRSSNGNEALSIFNAVLGNILGVVFTPGLLLLLVGRAGAISIVVRRSAHRERTGCKRAHGANECTACYPLCGVACARTESDRLSPSA